MSTSTGGGQGVLAAPTQPVCCGPDLDFGPEFDFFALDDAARAQIFADYNLPPEPNKDTEVGLYQFWRELFSAPRSFDNTPFIYAPPPKREPPSPQNVVPRSRHQSSLNWSGASLIAHDGRIFTDVTGKWTVPEPKVPTGGSPTDEYKSSCWVGLDGQRAYADSTLPQIGTEQSYNKDDLQVGAAAAVWFQWWPLDEQIIPTLPVTFGDTMYCWLTAMSYTRVRCIIRVDSAGSSVLKRFCVDAPTYLYDLPPKISHPASISGATAEWVTEAPTSRAKGMILPLPDYTRVEFNHCYALSARTPDVPEADRHLEPLSGPTLTHMYKIEDGRRVTISRAERPAEDTVPALNVVRTEFVK